MDNARHDPDAAMFESDDLIEPPRWPKVVGTISIVWAVLGLGCGVCGLAGPYIGAYMAPPDMKAQMPPMTPPPLLLGVHLLGMLNGVLLLVAGIMLVSRKPISTKLHLICAVVSLPLTAVAIYLSMQQQAALAQWAQQNPTSPFAKGMQGPGAGVGQAIGLVIGGLFGLAYPVFCLIWFGAVKRGAPLDIPREQIV